MYTGIPPPPTFPTDFDQTAYPISSQGPHISPFNEDNFLVSAPNEQDQADLKPPLIRIGTPPPIPVLQKHSNQGSSAFKSVLSMPIPGTKLAPEKFRGDFHKVKEFIQHYERLCTQNDVVLDREKCETLLRYCSKREKQTIKNIPSYNSLTWSKLRYDILRLYDADLDTKRYRVKDVRNFSRKQKTNKIRDLAAWKKYCRKFLRVAGSLLNGGKISQKEYATYFWQGIPKALKIRIENRILTRNPLRDLSEPYSVSDIDAAAEAILQRDRFDTALDDSDSDDEESSGNEASSEDSDSDSSDSDSEDEKRRKKRKAKSYSKKSNDSTSSGKTETPKKRMATGSRREVEGLIKQMNLLTRDDPKYGLAYYRAMKLDTDVSKIVGVPMVQPTYAPIPSRSAPSSFQQSIQPFTSHPIMPPQSPPTFPPRPFNPIRTQNPVPFVPRGTEIVCFGCGEKGHGMLACSKIIELTSKGLITRDGSGRFVNKDGTTIRRINGETFVQAIEREQRPQSHFITIQSDEELYGESESEQYESDNEAEAVYAIRGNDINTYEVERPAKQIATKRKLVMDGVYPPQLKDLKSKKENKNPETGRTNRSGKDQPRGVGIPREIKKKDKSSGDPKPVDVQGPRYDGSRDDQIIEDAVLPSQKDISKRKDSPNLVSEDRTIEKKSPRKSAVSAHVNPFKILDHVLNTKVELAVGEIIGVSRELSTLLADSIKVRTQPSAPVGLATSFRTKTRGLLIKLMMECDGVPIQAIIDTGSQLNIVSESACNSKIRRPIDRQTSISMNDANGGEGNLNGIVENVPLNCGGVMTQANLYVGEHVPFDLLLGRPWQRGNYVSIDERRDGTYLLFKDPKNLEARYEVLVTPDSMTPVDWDFDPSTWFAQEGVMSYFIDTDKLVIEADQQVQFSKDKPIWERNQNLRLSHSGTRVKEKSELQNILSDVVLRQASDNFLKEDHVKSIKEQSSTNEHPSISSFLPANKHHPEMEIQLVPARVRHDSELPSLFDSPPSIRTEAERLLMGQGDLTHLGNSQHTRHIIASSPTGIIVGHVPDQHGNQRTDMMLFNMGLISAISPNAPNSSLPIAPSAGVDVQYGVGILHFYPNLGSDAPGNWEIPYFRPPYPVSVSSDTWSYQNKWADHDPFQVPHNSAIYSPVRSLGPELDQGQPTRPSNNFGFDSEQDSDFEFTSASSSDIDSDVNDEDTDARIHHFNSNHDSRTNPDRKSLIINRVSSNGSLNSDISFTRSMPDLEIVSDSSSSHAHSFCSLPQSSGRESRNGWNRNLVEIMTEDRNIRLREWKRTEDRAAEEQENFRQEEMIKGITEIVAERDASPSPDLLSRRSAVPTSTNNCPVSLPILARESGDVIDPFPSASIKTIDPRLAKRREILEGILSKIRIPGNSDSFPVPEQVLHEQRLASGEIIPRGIDHSPPSPINVFSVSIPSPIGSPILRPSAPLIGHLDLPELEYPEPVVERTHVAVRPTIVYGADETRMAMSGELVEQVPEYLTGPLMYPEDRRALSLNETLSSNLDYQPMDIPSPTDTEPVDRFIIPDRREFPPAQPNRLPIRELSPEVDMQYGTKVPQYVQPFIDTGFPDSFGNGRFTVQNFTRLGPRTNKSVPIYLRTYYPYADSKIHIPIPRVDRIVVIDVSTLSLPGVSDSLTQAMTDGKTQIFSLLSPRPPHFDPVFFPGYITPNYCGPLDLPNVTATNLGERYLQLREARQSIITLNNRLRKDLPSWLVKELDDAKFALYGVKGEKLEKKFVDRASFFRSIHPVFNPLITDSEATFLRGAAYAYYRFRQDAIANTIDEMLRSPHYDFQLCRELLELGCLDLVGMEETAYRFLEEYENHARGEGEHEFDEYINHAPRERND